MPACLLLARHGETAANAEHRLAGHADVALTAEGRAGCAAGGARGRRGPGGPPGPRVGRGARGGGGGGGGEGGRGGGLGAGAAALVRGGAPVGPPARLFVAPRGVVPAWAFVAV